MTTLAALPTPVNSNKIPVITALFWIIKMMSTTVGGTGVYFLNADLHFSLAGTTVAAGALLAIALFFQVRAKRHVPSLYWMSVVFISVIGTLITDNLSAQPGIPVVVSAGVFGTAMIATFALWHAKEHTLSIRAIDNRNRELFYWVATLFAFALGSAAGDWAAEGLRLGYGNSALLFGSLIAATAFAHYVLETNAVACFWIAYVLTCPFGASLSDLLSKPVADGGLGMGTLDTSLYFLVTIVALVAYLSVAQRRFDRRLRRRHRPYADRLNRLP